MNLDFKRLAYFQQIGEKGKENALTGKPLGEDRSVVALMHKERINC
jgi:hypothetical protein